jgi:disulfide bond formation protein DsbB
MTGLIIIWLIICVIFLGLTIFHAFLYFGQIKRLEVTRLQKSGVSIKIAGQSIDKPMEGLVEQLNVFVDALNTGNRKANGAQTLGYAMAFITAVISLILTLKG